MKKVFLLIFIAIIFCGCKQNNTKYLTSDSFFEIINLEIGSYEYSIFSLSETAVTNYPNLNIFMNNLLYNGLSANEWLNNKKQLIESEQIMYINAVIRDKAVKKGNLLSIFRDGYTGPGFDGGNTSPISFTAIVNIQNSKLLTAEDLININDDLFKYIIFYKLSEYMVSHGSENSELDNNYLLSTLEIFLTETGIGFHFPYAIGKWSVEIILPYTLIGYFLTPLGTNELLN
ncbi:MAG: hypothetical protein FWD47_10680 [Treponema sp.]|nr:hypothetical protein [Treponema sp.]